MSSRTTDTRHAHHAHRAHRIPRNLESLALLPFCLLALAAAGCASEDTLTGTWHDPNATTQLPDVIGGGTLMVDATLMLDDMAAPGVFDLMLELEYETLSDSVHAHGTYVDNGPDLTLTFEGFEFNPDSGNNAVVGEDGSQCVLLMGFGGAGVCFPVPQSNDHRLDGDRLQMTIDQAIAGAAPNQTVLDLARVP